MLAVSPAENTSISSERQYCEGSILGAEEYTAAGFTEALSKLTFKRLPLLLCYNPNRIRKDLEFDPRYAIVRWDRLVLALCKLARKLERVVAEPACRLKGLVSDAVVITVVLAF